MQGRVPLLDVRAEIRAGKEPLPQILAFVKDLPERSSWRLLATFEPIPLLRLMASRGYQAESQRLPGGDWEVSFSWGASEDAPRAIPTAVASAAAMGSQDPTLTLDNRGLLPPEPMMRVLDAVSRLGPGEVLEVQGDRPPVFLYPELEARGYRVETEEHTGGVRLRISVRGG